MPASAVRKRKRRSLRQAMADGRGQQIAPQTERRFESAYTDRLNEAHWSLASGQHINDRLRLDLDRLIDRIAHEAINNPMVEGVIETHVADVVGPTGPTLQVQSDSESFNQWFENEAWSPWWVTPDAERRRCGVDILGGWVRGLWRTGNPITELVSDPSAPRELGLDITLRLKAHHARYLVEPVGSRMTSGHVAIRGVEIEPSFGRAVAYHLVRAVDQATYNGWGGETVRIPAANVLHLYRIVEEGQALGVPLLASCLQTIADLRDADVQILDAIRQAADFAVGLYSEDPDAEPLDPGTSIPFERRQMTALPGGYKPESLKGEQPSTDVLAFRDEKLRELGRPAGMPLEKVKASSKDMNFSQTKHGQGNYWRCVESLRGLIDREGLRRLAWQVERETRAAQLVAGRRVPAMPTTRAGRPDYQIIANWPPPPKIDPRIEAMALAIERGAGGKTMTQIAEANGLTLEQLVEQHAREMKVYADRGVPYPVPADALKAAAAMGGEADDEADKPSEPQPEPADA
ncbi:MAG: phage portal protein [Planctomycetota bacterium]